MPSSNTSLDTNVSELKHLDIAYIVILLPLLLVIKAPMLLFMALVLGLLIFRKEPTNTTIAFTALAGLFAIFIALYGTFNFAGLSRLKLFIEMLIYLLILAVSLQRLTREINFYLLLSPILILALSLFFFHSVVMLGYVVFEIFVLLWTILSYRMQGSFDETIRLAGTMFLFSLPWVVVLFIFFPRISFEHATYGFKGETERRTGHDGTMYLDNKALLVPSDRVVMEVGFEGRVPPAHQLYFRGSMLYLDKKNHWEPMPRHLQKRVRQSYQNIEESLSYKVTLYPTQKNWLYLLDMPIKTPQIDNQKLNMDADFIITSTKSILEPLHYQANSALKYTLRGSVDNITRNISLSVDRDANPTSWQKAKEIKERTKLPQERVKKVIQLFQSADLTYTLKPKPLDLNNSTDSFLFDSKFGYCVHFASSFVTMSRMVGVPARVVTGYLGDPSNSVNNYLAVKERNAHAWAELLIDERWVRYETTAWASKIEEESQALLNQNSDTKEQTSQINLYLMYIKYQVETWILHYSHFRQLELLDKARNDPIFVAKFVASILFLILISFLTIRYIRRPKCEDKLLCLMRPLLERLKKEGYIRKDEETMHRFLLRYAEEHPEVEEIADIDKLYEQIKYAQRTEEHMFALIKKDIELFLAR